MAAIKLKNKHNGFTMLPDRFIDEYMPLANGEYVKVYLYLLRQANLAEPHVSVEDIAENLMHTEKDIMRALKYWEKQGLLKVSFSEDHEYDSIELLLPDAGQTVRSGFEASKQDPQERRSDFQTSKQDPQERRSDFQAPQQNSQERRSDFQASESDLSANRADFRAPESDLSANRVDFQALKPDSVSHDVAASPVRRSYSPQEIEEITERESLEELIFVITSYMGRPLSQTELSSIIYFHDQLGFSTELIEYLFEYCISKNHKSIRYIEKTALNWAAEHISTSEEAKRHTAGYSEDCFAVLKAFGISGRNPVESEIRFVNLWRNDYGMSQELIIEACSRTMAAIHTPSFEYADGILASWKKTGVRSPEDVKKLDEAFAAKKLQASGAGRSAGRQNRGQADAARVGARSGGGHPSQTKFSNFEERNYSVSDDADLEKFLLTPCREQQTGS